MSQMSLEALTRQFPEYKRALRKLEEWLNKHPDVQAIDAGTIARELRSVEPEALAHALTLLVKAGLLRRTYKVLTPAGVLAEGEFDDPTTIPPKLPDRFQHYFETAEADVVPVFRRVA